MRTVGTSPGSLDEHTAVVREDGTMFVFGGFNEFGELNNNLFSFSIRDNSWSLISQNGKI